MLISCDVIKIHKSDGSVPISSNQEIRVIVRMLIITTR